MFSLSLRFVPICKPAFLWCLLSCLTQVFQQDSLPELDLKANCIYKAKYNCTERTRDSGDMTRSNL